MGSLKYRAARIAAGAGRPGAWASDDVEAARLQAKQCVRVGGPHGPSPETLWRSRSPILLEVLRWGIDLSTIPGTSIIVTGTQMAMGEEGAASEASDNVRSAALLLQRLYSPELVSSSTGERTPSATTYR